MLTGESVPIIKAHIPNTNHMFNPKHDHKYILYAGTKVIQKRSVGKSKVLGVVLNTGFNTEKGNLIRSIIFPKESEFNFKTDSVKYIYFMACLSIIGFSISLPFLLNTNMSFYEIIVKALDLVTTTVPPALPACIGIGITYSLSRLKEYGIICHCALCPFCNGTGEPNKSVKSYLNYISVSVFFLIKNNVHYVEIDVITISKTNLRFC